MLYKVLIGLGLVLLMLAIVLFSIGLRKKNIRWSSSTPLVQSAQGQCKEEPSMREPTHQLIQNTWQAHASKEGNIPIEQCLLFIRKFLSQKDIKKMRARGNVHLTKTDSKGGEFKNTGAPITMTAVINGEKYEITIPKTFKGVYETSKDRCLYFPQRNATIVVCKRVYLIPFYADVESLDAQQTALYVYFDNKDSNICFYFEK